MAKVKILGNVFQVKSDLTREELEKAEKYSPNTTTLYDEDGNETFKVGFGSPSLTKYGVSFSETDDDGHVYLTASVGAELNKADFADEFAIPISKLEMVEHHVKECMEEISKIEQKVIDSIEEV